eukprot:m.7312 g.7312  ORF g.7312 m.7312 type:complete len:312 (-) comp5718_c0_seq1:52-987(-)
MSDLAFDPTLKKKKKKKGKKKTLVTLEETTVVDETPQEKRIEDTVEDVQENEEAVNDETAAVEEVNEEPAAEETTTKKKKKKKKSKVEPLAKSKRDAIVQLLLSGDIQWKKFLKNKSEDGALGFDVTSKKKKKTKKSKKYTSGAGDSSSFSYEDLLDNVFEIIKDSRPKGNDETEKIVIVPPNIARMGVKKTGFSNFVQVCKMLHRDRDHVLSFLHAELGTTSSMDQQECLILKGRYQQRDIERVLRAYIKEYVTCHTCNSPKTLLTKQARLHFLQCETCKSRCSVAQINAGVHKISGRRAVMRAKGIATS